MNEFNANSVFSFEPSFNPFYEQSCSYQDVTEIVEQLEMQDHGEQ